MENPKSSKHLAAVIGAGPAGLFAARELANAGVHVSLFNRDIKPGGLAEYGIFLRKHKMKTGLRNQFNQILALEDIDYFGNISISKHKDLNIDKLRELRYQAILIAVGAQGTKELGIPGEKFTGVYHAKDLVYHYNHLPPYSQWKFDIGQKVAIIGVGNVMTDIANYLISMLHVQDVTAIARRGPAEIKFDKKELEAIASNLDIDELDQEIEHARPVMERLGENPEEPKMIIHAAFDRANLNPPISDTHFHLRFLLSPIRILGDEHGRVCGLEVEKNELVSQDNMIKAIGTGDKYIMDVDTVIFAIGDTVDSEIGLPVHRGEFIKNTNPRYPIEGLTYEAYDPINGHPFEDIFVAGWSRKASTGLVGIARKDGVNGARAMLQYLNTLPKLETLPLHSINTFINSLNQPVVRKEHLFHLQAAENEQAQLLGLEEFKYSTNEDMLAAMNLMVAI